MGSETMTEDSLCDDGDGTEIFGGKGDGEEKPPYPTPRAEAAFEAVDREARHRVVAFARIQPLPLALSLSFVVM